MDERVDVKILETLGELDKGVQLPVGLRVDIFAAGDDGPARLLSSRFHLCNRSFFLSQEAGKQSGGSNRTVHIEHWYCVQHEVQRSKVHNSRQPQNCKQDINPAKDSGEGSSVSRGKDCNSQRDHSADNVKPIMVHGQRDFAG